MRVWRQRLNALRHAWLVLVVLMLPALVCAQLNQMPVLPEAPSPSGPSSLTPEEYRDRVSLNSQAQIRYENDVAYAPGRTTIHYQQYTIEADRMIVDFVSEEVQAEGNVIF